MSAPIKVLTTLVDKKSTDKSMNGQKNTDKNVHPRGPSVQILSVQFFKFNSNDLRLSNYNNEAGELIIFRLTLICR